MSIFSKIAGFYQIQTYLWVKIGYFWSKLPRELWNWSNLAEILTSENIHFFLKYQLLSDFVSQRFRAIKKISKSTIFKISSSVQKYPLFYCEGILWQFLVKIDNFSEKNLKNEVFGWRSRVKTMVKPGFKTRSSTLLSDYWTWMYRRLELGQNLEFWQLKDRFQAGSTVCVLCSATVVVSTPGIISRKADYLCRTRNRRQNTFENNWKNNLKNILKHFKNNSRTHSRTHQKSSVRQNIC